MRSKRLRIVILLSILAGAAFAQEKYALVIGNSEYRSVTKLKNAANDASDMAEALKRRGFKVDLLMNSPLGAMEEAVVRLGNDLARSAGAYGLFFYAGHGVQSSGSNYLIPVDADIKSESFLKSKALQVQSVLDTLQQAGNGLNVVVLDACRDNPFGWSRGGARGLSVVGIQPPGSIIVYATSAGAVAQDGDGRNGMFTGQLLKNLASGGLEVSELFRKTCADVVEESKRAQIPAIYSQFFGTAYLSGSGPAAAAGAAAAPAVAAAVAAPAPVAKGKIRIAVTSPGVLEFRGQSSDVAGKSVVEYGDVEPGSYRAVMRYPDGATEAREVAAAPGGRGCAPFVHVPAKPRKELTLADFASSFLGLSPNNTIEDVVAILGPPTESVDNSSKGYSFDSYYWEAAHHHIAARVDRRSGGLVSLALTWNLLLSDTLSPFLRSRGLADPRVEFVRADRREIAQQFGKPVSDTAGVQEYSVKHEGKTVLVKFTCSKYDKNACSAIDVHWLQ